MARRRLMAVVGAILAAAVVAGVIAADSGLPWQSRAHEVARGTENPSPTGSPTLAQPQEPHVNFTVAFPKLPALDRPTNMVELPTHWMLVSLQDGRIVTFPNDPDASSLTIVADLRARVSRDGNEEGLLGMAVPPRASPGALYLYYSARPGERRTVLSSFQFSGGGGADLRVDPSSEQILLMIPQPYPNHKGGQLTFGPDAMLYLGVGDGGSEGDPDNRGQDLRQLYSKILRIDVRAPAGQPYAIPSDNPFASSPNGARPETWVYGLRNPWRFSFDYEGAKLWIGDVGQNTWEEIDIGERGKNYGWSATEGFHCYKPSNGCDQQGLQSPVVEYSHDHGNCSVTGGYVYRGNAVPSLRGWYVYGDYCTGAIWAIPADSAPGSRPTPVVLRASGPQIASFAQDSFRQAAPPELYLLCFDGKIYRISP